MLYQKATVENGAVKIIESKEIGKSTMTSDCWLIQFEGLKACAKCEFRNTKECGGGATLKRLKLKK